MHKIDLADDFIHPLSGELSICLLESLAGGADLVTMANLVLLRLIHLTGCHTAGILVQRGAAWKPVCWHGAKTFPKPPFVERVADQTCTIASEGWVATSLKNWPGGAAILVASDDANAINPLEPAIGAIRAVLSLAIPADRTQNIQMCRRLREMFLASAAWRIATDTDSLLRQIAVSAAKTLDADRASIFLHDAQRGLLIGRPALGVVGGVLEVAANAGLVGAVLQSGKARRWAAMDPIDEVNRKVDQQLSYQTRSLVAVPMRDGQKIIGVFELINHLGDAPFDGDDEEALELLASHAVVAINSTREREKLIESRERVAGQAAAAVEIVGDHPAMQTLRKAVIRVAKTDLSVLLLGDNGTGKEVVARTIHFNSARRQEPFVAVNCAALVETLLESELFGHEKGAFTDAVASRPGKFELAHGGTLFLDEIGDLSPSGQAKLLRVLEERIIVRVGGSVSIPTDVRVITATNQPLAEWVATGRFRQDLFYRLNVVTLSLPALHQRGDDVLQLAQHFLEQFCRRAGRSPPKLSTAARSKLQGYRWPGNVRELRNVMERIAYLSLGDEVTADDVELVARSTVRSAGSQTNELELDGLSLAEATQLFQTRYIQATIDRKLGQMTEAARQLGLHRTNLYRKMKQLNMDPPNG